MVTAKTAWTIPYLLDPRTFAVDAFVSFCVALMFAIMVNAEAQAWVATLLGDSQPKAKDRFNFNAFLHLDVLGTLCFLVGGFGWPRPVAVYPENFRYPRLFLVITRLAGPLANLILANIAASLAALIAVIEYDPLVLNMLLGVNVTVAVYNLLPLPPLALGVLIVGFLPERFSRLKWLINQAAPFLVLAIVLVERLTGQGIISPYLNPLVKMAIGFIQG